MEREAARPTSPSETLAAETTEAFAEVLDLRPSASLGTPAEIVHASTWVELDGQPAVEMVVERIDQALRLRLQFVGRFSALGVQEGPFDIGAEPDAIDEALSRVAQRLGLRLVTEAD